MLIVSRRKGQRIVLGNDIEIVITDITRSGVKIGIVAPSSLTILRGEVKDVAEANREALESSFSVPVPPVSTPDAEAASASSNEPAILPVSASAMATTAQQPASPER